MAGGEGVADAVTPLALAALVAMQAFGLVRSALARRNGGSRINPGDAREFWELQQGIDRKLDELLRTLKRR